MGRNIYSDYTYAYGDCREAHYYDFKNKARNVKYYVDYMLDRTQQMFKYGNLPDTIPQKFLENILQRNGFAVIGEVNGNLYAFRAGLGGAPSVYYQPTLAVVANPALDLSVNWKIHEECVLIRNDFEMIGLIPVSEKYASLLVENDITMRLENINKRIPVIAAVHNDNQKASLDRMIDRVVDGDHALATTNDFAETLQTMPYSETGARITDEIEYQQYLRGLWYNELGVKAAYNMKREALSEHEVSLNDDMLIPFLENMMECRKTAVEEINKLFGTNITVDYNSVWKKSEITEISEKKIEALEIDSIQLDNDIKEKQLETMDEIPVEDEENNSNDSEGGDDSNERNEPSE